MSKASYTLYIIIVTLILAGCQGESKYYSRLRALDSVLVQSPDSVYKVLVAEEKEAQQLSHSDRMYYELLRADAQNKAYIDFTTDSIMKEVADYYDHHGTANQQMRAHYLLGCTYRDLGDAPMELQCFLEATEKADTTQQDCDLYTLAAIYGQIADIYHSQYLPEEELRTWQICEKIARIDKDTLSEIDARCFQARTYLFMDEPDSVLSIIEEARTRYLAIDKKQKAAIILDPAIGILIDRKDYKSASQYVDIFDRESGYYDSNGAIAPSAAIHLRNKGRLCLAKNKTDSAIYYFRELQKYGYKEASYQGLLNCFSTLMKDSLVKYAELYAAAKDSSTIGTNSELIAKMGIMYNYAHQEKIAKQKTIESAKAKELNLLLTITIIIIIFIVTIIAIAVRNYHNRKIAEQKKQEEKLYRLYNGTKQKIKELENEIQNVKDLRESDTTKTAIIEKLQKEILEYKKEKDIIQQKLESYNHIKNDIEFTAWLEQFKQTDIVQSLWGNIIKLKPNKGAITIQQTINLINQYKSDCKNFYALLTSPEYGLNELDRMVILLDICDFETRDISILLNKPKQQISNTHNRIKNKLYPDVSNTYKLKQRLLETLKASL